MEKGQQLPHIDPVINQLKNDKKIRQRKITPDKKDNNKLYSGHRIQSGYMLVL